MKARSYTAALNQVLEPAGFQRDGKDWIRVRGDMWECVNLQVSSIAGTTANLMIKDLELEKLVRAIPTMGKPIPMIPITVRIGRLIDNYDHWWRGDPEGPTQLSDVVRVLGLPYFDLVRTPEEQAVNWFGRGSGTRWHASSRIYLALTLYRMGEIAEACEALRNPPKTAIPEWRAHAEAVSRWLGCGDAAP